MPVATIHDIYCVKANTTIVGGMVSQGISTGTQIVGENIDGEVYPRIQSISGQVPGAKFETLALAEALDTFGTEFYAPTGAGVTLYAHKHAEGGTRAGATSHKSYAIADGIVVPRTLSIDHQGTARLAYDVVATYDGSNNPIVIAEGVSLPTASGASERFTIGPCTINNILFTGIRSLEIDFGIQLATEGSDSDIWPTHVSVAAVRPTFTFRGVNMAWFKDSGGIPLIGGAPTHANSTIFLRKRAAGGTYVADGTAEHIALTLAGLAYIPEPFQGSSNSAAESTLMVATVYDGTNAPIVADTSSAIS